MKDLRAEASSEGDVPQSGFCTFTENTQTYQWWGWEVTVAPRLCQV